MKPLSTTPPPADRRTNGAPCRILLSNFETAVPFGVSDREIVEAVRRHGMGDGFCGWFCHMHGAMDLPEPLNGETLLAAFWPNNPYYERRAAQRGVTVEEYVRERFDQIRRLHERMGDRFLWCLGWETFTSSSWSLPDGAPPRFGRPEEGFAFYREWLTTSAHIRHWHNSTKFGQDRFNRRPGVIEELARRGLSPSDFNLLAGDFYASRAHSAFQAVPGLAGFWWECGITATALPVGIPFVRGAARQYGKLWVADVSPFSYPHPLHEDRFYEDLGEWGAFEQRNGQRCRLNFPKYTRDMVRLAGYTPEMLLRCWLAAYMAGCDILFQEASSLSHFVKADGGLRVTPVGRAAGDLAAFHRRVAGRGEPFTPVTLLLDQYHGIEPHGAPAPWSYMPLPPAARQVSAFFEAAYPGHSQVPEPLPWKDPEEYGRLLRAGFDYRPYERRLLCPGRWADIFDVTLTDAPRAAFLNARVILLLGPHDPRRLDEVALWALAAEGRTIVLAAGCGIRASWLPDARGVLPGTSAVVVDATSGKWHNDAPFRLHRAVASAGWEVEASTEAAAPVLLTRPVGCGRIFFVAADCGLDAEGNLCGAMLRLLDTLLPPLIPFEVKGPPVQWSLNRAPQAWMLLLMNHGATPWSGEVVFRAGTPCVIHDCWRDKRLTDSGNAAALTIPPYAPCVLEFRPLSGHS